MIKKLLCMAALCLGLPLSGFALEDGTYYLWNVGAGRWMNFGGTDGYTSCFYHYGSPITLTAVDGGYTITGTHYDDTNGLSATGAGRTTSATFTITETAEGSGLYTIKADNGYFGYDATLEAKTQAGTLVSATLSDDGSDNVHWQLLTKADLEARLADASEENPVDATFYISCPGFNRHEPGIKTDWTLTSFNVAGFYYEPNQHYWNTNSSSGDELADMNQTLTGLKEGKYVLTCQGFYRAGSNTVAYTSYSGGTYPYNGLLYAGDETCPLLAAYEDGQETSDIYTAAQALNSSWTWTPTTTKGGLVYPYYADGNTYPSTSAAVAFDYGLYQAREGYNTVHFTVGSSGTVTIGAKTTAGIAYDWIAIDNMHLEYLGEESQEEKSEELIAAQEQALAAIDSIYTPLLKIVQPGEALTTFQTAVENAKTNIDKAKDKDAVEAIMAELAEAYQTLLRDAQPIEGEALDYTQLMTNPSFETGDLTGWVYTALKGADAAVYTSSSYWVTAGIDGQYLYNTWINVDSYVSDTQDQYVYQTVKDLPEGQYRVMALEASNNYASASTPVEFFANNFSRFDVPQHKETFTEFTLDSIFVTPDVRSLTIGMRSASWFKADNFRLYYMGKTAAYEAYKEAGYADASLKTPVMFDNHDGQQSSAFTYTEIGGHTHGGYPLATGGVLTDGSPVDRSVMQDWTGNTYQLGHATLSTTYNNLPDGYYKISSNVRVYDLNGDYDGTATGLYIYANDKKTAITNGTQITVGNNSGKGFWGNYSVITKLEDGNLETGLLLDSTSMSWVGMQDFRVEYIGTKDPMEELVNLNLPADTYVALCMPYDLKPEYFGQTYKVAQIADGKATLFPVSSVTAGTPCVVKATGKNPEITLSDVSLNFSTPGVQLEMWGNVYMRGNYDNYTWTATLADADNTQVEGSTLTYSELDPENLEVEMTVVNRQAEKFLNECKYVANQSTTVIANYNTAPPARRDQPNIFRLPMTDGKEYIIANMIPDSTYTFEVTDGNGQRYAGSVKATGTVRMLYIPSGYNIRDLGGWTMLSKHKVQYGKLYRGAALNGNIPVTDEDLQTMKDLGIGAEIDLRWKDGYSNDKSTNISAFGFTKEDSTYYFAGANDYLASDISVAESQARWAEEFRFALHNLRLGKGVYFHCAVGADRTGLLAMMLEGILGFSEGDIYRDYELTSYGCDGMRYLTNWKDRLAVIKNNYTGITLTKKFEKYFKQKLGITAEEIEEFRALVLQDYVNDIEAVETENQNSNNSIYDLSGRRLNRTQHGIYIVGGKKIMVK